MTDNFDHLQGDDKLKAENDFLKMKMMLENGAQFHMESDLPTGVENDFLKRILAMEKFEADPKYIKLYDKMGRPTQFKPVTEIPDNEIENAWRQLEEFLATHLVSLSVMQPNVGARELYRFTTEELFQQEVDDLEFDDMTSCFYYDDFHPDYEYENTRHALEECLQQILCKKPLDDMTFFRSKNLELNEHAGLPEKAFQEKINRFKEAYDTIDREDIENVACKIDEQYCDVTGDYRLQAKLGAETISIRGKWLVRFGWDEDTGGWDIFKVSLEGIRF
jgi:hypothetical protein